MRGALRYILVTRAGRRAPVIPGHLDQTRCAPCREIVYVGLMSPFQPIRFWRRTFRQAGTSVILPAKGNLSCNGCSEPRLRLHPIDCQEDNPMLRRTRYGLLRAFLQQHGALRMSVSGFDFGHLAETARIANAIFILLGPPSRAHRSIVDALGWQVLMPSTRPMGSLLVVECVPVEAVGDQPASWFIHALPAGREALRSEPRLSTVEWWTEAIVTRPEGPLNRLDMIRILRDRDGGAHLDLTITSAAYKAVLLHGAGFNFQPSATEPAQPVEHSIEAIVRQIAEEVLQGLQGKVLAAQLEMRQLAAAGATELFEDLTPT